MSDPILAMAAASQFPLEGGLTTPSLGASVTVQRDAFGVPRITADTLEDLWFAQGFVTAGERLFQLDLLLRAATGRLSEYFGPLTVDDDVFVRTIGLNRAGARHAAEVWDEQDHAMHGRFREGIDAWIAQIPVKPVEYQILDLDPAEIPNDAASHAAAFAFLAWNLSNNWEAELLRAELDAALGPGVTDTLLPSAPAGGGVGSNNWVVAGRRTTGGGPLLANDPHLLVTQPGIWLELHLRAPGYEARGVATPFSPGIFLGTTPHHAWGVTNVTGDVQDLYEERLNDDGTAARHGDEWEPLTIHEERISVRGEDEPRAVNVRESRHGPILTHGVSGLLRTRYRPIDGTYALRWTGHDATMRPMLALEVANALDADAFGKAIREIVCPGQNFVYADVDGTIAYQATGRHPIRAAGDGTRPVPGWKDDHEWIGWIPAEELPAERDPERGWIATANHDIHPEGYPHLIAKDFHASSRYERICELLEATDRHDVASLAAIQLDDVSRAARSVLPRLTAVEPTNERQQAALDALAAWDGSLAVDSHEAALFQAWITALMRRLVDPRLTPEVYAAYEGFRETFLTRVLPELLAHGGERVDPSAIRDALQDAIDETGDATWGELHHLVIAHPLARIPGLEAVFMAADTPFAGDDQTIAQGGFDPGLGYQVGVIPSIRAIYDLGDVERSVTVVPSGVSGNPASPHWADQHALYASGRTKPAGFATEAVATLTIAPA